MRSAPTLLAACIVVASVVSGPVLEAEPQALTASAATVSEHRALLDQHCVTCHNERLQTAGLTLDTIDLARVGDRSEVWEKVVRKLRAGSMPPPPRPRPDSATYDGFRTWLEAELDRAATDPDPGRTDTFHRLNRTEYRNAIRDLLDVDIDVASLLPPDAVDQHGFDNNAGAL